MVGAGVFDCRHGNFHPHDHRDTGDCVFGEHDIFAVGVRVHRWADSDHYHFVARIFSRGVSDGLCRDREALRQPHALCCWVTFLATRTLAEGVRVSAIALVVSVALGTSERLAVFIVIALTVLYTFEGGMKAVIWTDVAQFLLYLTGSLLTLGLLLHRIPGGWAEVSQVAAVSGNKLRVLDFSWNLATKYTFWSGVIGARS